MGQRTGHSGQDWMVRTHVVTSDGHDRSRIQLAALLRLLSHEEVS